MLENTFPAKAKNIVLVMGKSGSGKDTLVDKVCKSTEVSPPPSQIISYTTRPRRRLEGDTHVFVNEPMPPSSEVIAWTKYHGHHYWSTKEQVAAHDLYIIDPPGAISLLDNEEFLRIKLPVIVYLDVHWWTRLKRITKRNGFIYAVKRIWVDRKQFRGAERLADYVFKNDKSSDIEPNRKNILELIYQNME